MKKILILFSFLLTTAISNAQTIHWLLFIDTKDRNVGEIDVLGRQVLKSHFVDEVNAALAPKGYKSDIHDYYDSRLSPENCKAAVEMLRVQPEDIIVFYYIGHGARPVSNDPNYIKSHPYPQMCMGQHDQNKFIPLEWVYKQLSSKGARLSVTIGMCCNSLANITIKDSPTFTPNYGVTYMSNNKLAKIQELFLGARGNVLATSASPTQTSGCLRSNFGVIDAYTTVLCNIFDNSLDNYSGKLTWDYFLEVMSDIVDERMGGEQTPIHETHLNGSSVPSNRAPSQQKAQQPRVTKSGNGWLNELTELFDVLISNQVREEQRLNMKEKMVQIFTSNAQVRILGQDSETVVDRENASAFLGRLATSRLLLKVSVVDGEMDSNGRITSLKVREVYKK